MQPSSSSTPPSPLVAAFLAEIATDGPAVDLAIEPRDEMLEFLLGSCQGDRDRALFAYFQSGWSIAESLLQVLRWRFGDDVGEGGRIGRLLDFASGYGRVSRFILRELPPERVWVSDVYPEAVRFQEERFGVHGLVSTVRPEDFACSERFDVILVTSLFTHLREDRFIAWLAVLCRLLAPGGILIWSVHDQALLVNGEEMPASGLLFQEISESGSLAGSDYGSAWVTEAFVRRALERVAAGASLHRIPRALCNYQDLYVAVLEPEVDFSGFAFHGEPDFFLEHASVSGADLFYLWGWTARRGAGALREVQVLLDGELMATSGIDSPRPEVAVLFGDRELRPGWGVSFRLPAGVSHSASVLLIRVVDDRRRAFPVWAGTIESALLRSSRNEVSVLVRELAAAREQAARDAAEAAYEIAEREARITAMEASRFWKMRNAWFGVKRRLGLTEER